MFLTFILCVIFFQLGMACMGIISGKHNSFKDFMLVSTLSVLLLTISFFINLPFNIRKFLRKNKGLI